MCLDTAMMYIYIYLKKKFTRGVHAQKQQSELCSRWRSGSIHMVAFTEDVKPQCHCPVLAQVLWVLATWWRREFVCLPLMTGIWCWLFGSSGTFCRKKSSCHLKYSKQQFFIFLMILGMELNHLGLETWKL